MPFPKGTWRIWVFSCRPLSPFFSLGRGCCVPIATFPSGVEPLIEEFCVVNLLALFPLVQLPVSQSAIETLLFLLISSAFWAPPAFIGHKQVLSFPLSCSLSMRGSQFRSSQLSIPYSIFFY